MGIPIPPPTPFPPSPPGVPCSVCWGAGKKWGIGETPLEVWVTFFGIEKGPTWNVLSGEVLDGDYKLTQVFPPSCRWELEFGVDGKITLTFSTLTSHLRGDNSEGRVVFNHNFAPLCSSYYSNDQLTDFEFGSGLITIPGVS